MKPGWWALPTLRGIYSLSPIPYPLNYGSQKRRLRARDRQYVGK